MVLLMLIGIALFLCTPPLREPSPSADNTDGDADVADAAAAAMDGRCPSEDLLQSYTCRVVSLGHRNLSSGNEEGNL